MNCTVELGELQLRVASGEADTEYIVVAKCEALAWQLRLESPTVAPNVPTDFCWGSIKDPPVALLRFVSLARMHEARFTLSVSILFKTHEMSL